MGTSWVILVPKGFLEEAWTGAEQEPGDANKALETCWFGWEGCGPRHGEGRAHRVGPDPSNELLAASSLFCEPPFAPL